MLKIDQISISNYKNIIAKELKINNFNLIVGPNNSGKSNFIQILSFLNHIINGALDEVNVEFKRAFFPEFGRIIPSQNKEKKGEILISIKFSDSLTFFQYHYKIIIGWKTEEKSAIHRRSLLIKEEEFEYKLGNKTGPPINIFRRESNKVYFGKVLKKEIRPVEIPENLSVVSLLKMLSREFNDNEITSSLAALNSILKTETIYFSNIELTKDEKSRIDNYSGRTVSFNVLEEIINISHDQTLFNYFKEVLNNILKINEIGIISLSIPNDKDDEKVKKEYMVRFSHLGSVKQLKEFSDGTVLLIALITKILVSKSDIFLIEEPENSIHPKALIDLLNFIQSFEEDKQFIIATHSIALINKVKADDVIISKSNEDGSSELFRVENSTELKKQLKHGFIVFSDLLFFNQDEIV